jgi:signal peptidase II
MSVRGRFALILLCLSTAACDRATKALASASLPGGDDRFFLGEFVRLTYAENTGAFLSLGADWPQLVRLVVFVGFSGIALTYLVWRLWTEPMSGWRTTGVALFLVGGALNLWDRIAQGYVVDFMILGVGRISTGIFNVADVALLCGAIMVVAGEALTWRRSDSPLT